MKDIPLEQRLIVAADFEPDSTGRRGVRQRVLALAQNLKGLGVVIKINSILRAIGYDLITEIHDLGLAVCADLKLVDIPNTMKTDGAFLDEEKPEFLTVMANAGVDGMKAIKAKLPGTEVWGVTVLTTFDNKMCEEVYHDDVEPTVVQLVSLLHRSGLDGVICSPKEARIVYEGPEWERLTINTPGIRYPWSEIKKDDQVRFLTAGDAMAAGTTRVVVGRPILNARPNDEPSKPQNPREAALLILGDIKAGLAKIRETH